MKKITFLFLTIFTTLGYGQDIVYNFDTDTEGWGQSGLIVSNDGTGHLQLAEKADTTWGNFSGAIGPQQTPTLDTTNYLYVKIVFENTTDFTTWQIVNHELGSNAITTASGKTDFNAPIGTGFTTAYVLIPSNGTNEIERISVRAKGQPTNHGTFKIDEFRVLDTPPTFSGCVQNPDFEDNKAFLTNWAPSSSDATAVLSMDSSHGLQSARVDIVSTPGSTVQFQNTYTLAFDSPVTTVTGDKVDFTFDMKSNSTDLEASIRFTHDINGGGTKVEYSAWKKVSATDTWESFTISKNLTVGNTYDNIRDLAFSIRSSVAGNYAMFDNIQMTITIGGQTLSISEKDFKNNTMILYPNPARDIITIKGINMEVASIGIYDITGKEVLKANKIFDSKVDISTLNKGIYIVKIEDTNGNNGVKKLIVSK